MNIFDVDRCQCQKQNRTQFWHRFDRYLQWGSFDVDRYNYYSFLKTKTMKQNRIQFWQISSTQEIIDEVINVGQNEQ